MVLNVKCSWLICLDHARPWWKWSPIGYNHAPLNDFSTVFDGWPW